MVPAFNPLRAANCKIYAVLCYTHHHSGCTVFLTALRFVVPEYCFQLIRSLGIAKGEKNVGYYVGVLVRVVALQYLEFLNETETTDIDAIPR